jgi:site-specific recombinase XerD
MQTLPANLAHLAGTYAPKTVKTYGGDLREVSLYLRDRKLSDITAGDLQAWQASLLSSPEQSQRDQACRRLPYGGGRRGA